MITFMAYKTLSEQNVILQQFKRKTTQSPSYPYSTHASNLVYYCRTHTKLHFLDPKIERKEFHRDDLLN